MNDIMNNISNMKLQDVIVIGALLLAIYLLYTYTFVQEGFRYYLPPNNCIRDVFGNLRCYPRYYRWNNWFWRRWWW